MEGSPHKDSCFTPKVVDKMFTFMRICADPVVWLGELVLLVFPYGWATF